MSSAAVVIGAVRVNLLLACMDKPPSIRLSFPKGHSVLGGISIYFEAMHRKDIAQPV